jgi:hypothetical protein
MTEAEGPGEGLARSEPPRAHAQLTRVEALRLSAREGDLNRLWLPIAVAHRPAKRRLSRARSCRADDDVHALALHCAEPHQDSQDAEREDDEALSEPSRRENALVGRHGPIACRQAAIHEAGRMIDITALKPNLLQQNRSDPRGTR